jgi:shikimate kinase
MMGSGKSTVGRLLGKSLQYPLLDTDAIIEQSTKRTVSEIFAEEGEDAFRDMETDVLKVRLCPSPSWFT